MKDFLFIVPARVGSKRLPGKNLLKLGKKTLLQWTDEALNKSFKKYEVLLTTDSIKIANQGKKASWNVPFLRPKILSEDRTDTLDVVLHALNWRINNGLKDPKYVMLLQLTSPFRSAENILTACKLLKSNEKINAVIGVSYLRHKMKNYYIINKNKLSKISDKNIDDDNTMVQPNGAIYAIKTHILRKYLTFVPPNTYPLLMDEISSIDIDNNFDLEIAKMVIKNKLIRS
jgi:N-acylneuraminate cytidylyltransferase/CMP-N,N'-diacetyllegionaminic acid synthase